jgi:drug/metabolite transporter (DMT)-like permease
MDWQLLTAVSVVGLSVSVLLQRVLLAKDKTDPVAYVIVFQGLVGVLTLFAALLAGFVWPDLSEVWPWALACTLLYAIGHMLYARALQLVEASVFAVLFATHAVWMSILGVIVFDESLGLTQIIGTLLVLASLTLIIKKPTDFRLDKGTMLGLLTGVFFGLAITAWGYVGRYASDPLSWSAVSFLAPAALVWLLRPGATKRMTPLLRGHVLVRMLALALFYAVGCAAMLLAYKYGDFSVVSPLRQSGVILTVLLALALLPAERTAVSRKLLAAAICLAGVACLV